MNMDDTLDTELDKAIGEIRANQDLVDRSQVLTVLEHARDQLVLAKKAPFGLSDAVLNADDFYLCLVQSARAEHDSVGPSPLALTGKDIIGFQQYNDLDVRWVATLWNRLTRTRSAFLLPPTNFELVERLPARTTIALAGDWGAGNDISRAVGAQIAALRPDYTIHLGDVYYSGTESEEQQNLVDVWPAGNIASYTLNSNHEMYSGGHGYFGIALADRKFQAHSDRSFFALVNDDWLVVGLDSAASVSSVSHITSRSNTTANASRIIAIKSSALSGARPIFGIGDTLTAPASSSPSTSTAHGSSDAALGMARFRTRPTT